MKKTIILMLSILLLAGCAAKDETNNIDSKNNTNALKEPILKWCQLYNPNGFDTITCIISNPNSVDIDITYDLVYYKKGKEVARSTDFSNFQVSNKHDDIIWANYNIPKKEDVDEIKMENIRVEKAYYNSVDATIKYKETVDDEMIFEVTHDVEPTLNNITFVLYKDNNKNKKCDEGEVVVASIDSTSEKEDTVSFDISGYDYTNYEIYYNAYVE